MWRVVVAKETHATTRIIALSPDDGGVIDLKNPWLAALLSWLVPGLGQLYQGRRTKGSLFMASLVTTLVVGLWLGGGRVVYAAWRPGEMRLALLGQVGIGSVAVPAVLQALRLGSAAREPYFASPLFAPPLRPGQPVSRRYAERLVRAEPGMSADNFTDTAPYKQFFGDQLSMWHERLGRWFDIGTLYTVLAGLLNMLVVYDAFAGPLGDQRPRDDDEPGDAAAGTARTPRP